MYKMTVDFSNELDETTYTTTLSNGLNVYICKKIGYKKKIALFGTKYGSLTNDFVDINTGERIVVPEGIAHFLEHKLFEKEGKNMLDVFSSKGISVNAYTSFEQTVYYFETISKFRESIELLVKLVKEPFFTDENVSKEQGIIAQEIKMYDDEAEYKVFFNTLKALYHNLPVRIDIAGTVESISKINKELLYTCYNTFYNLKNMFFIVVGDVDVEETLKDIEENVNKYQNSKNKSDIKIEKFFKNEPKEVYKSYIEEKMDIHLEQLCIGYKLDVVGNYENLKRKIVSSIINDMFFSKISSFYEEEYNKGIISEELIFEYEGNDIYSYVVIGGGSLHLDKLQEDIFEYIEKIKLENIDEELFELIKKNKIGKTIFKADSLNSSYRRIIDSIIDETHLYEEIQILENITKKDVVEFLQLITKEKQVVSVIKQK